MSLTRRRRFVTPFVLVLAGATALLAQNAQQNAADAERLIKALDIHAGSVVGEIGAGDGELTMAMAKAVGGAGRVLSNELNTQRLDEVGKRAAEGGIPNGTHVEGKEDETRIPDHCCDAV